MTLAQKSLDFTPSCLRFYMKSVFSVLSTIERSQNFLILKFLLIPVKAFQTETSQYPKQSHYYIFLHFFFYLRNAQVLQEVIENLFSGCFFP